MTITSNELVASLRRAKWKTEPFVWAVVDSFAPPAVATRLAQTFPTDGFASSERSNGAPGHSKSYRLESRILDVNDDVNHGPDWHGFLAALRSGDYREAMSDAVGMNLRGLKLELSLWRYPPGGWLGPHTDKPDKVVTQVFNLNPGWRREWGGCLCILASDQEEDIIAELPPVLNSSVVLRRSQNSWHMVTRTQVDDRLPHVRKVLTAMFRQSAP